MFIIVIVYDDFLFKIILDFYYLINGSGEEKSRLIEKIDQIEKNHLKII